MIPIFLGIATMMGPGIELYEFETVNPQITAFSPGTEIPELGAVNVLTLRVENNSFLNLYDVESSCHFRTLVGSMGSFEDISLGGLSHTGLIESGIAKVTTCGAAAGVDDSVTKGDIDFLINFKVRCFPIILCKRSTKHRFQLISSPEGRKWIEGDNFRP